MTPLRALAFTVFIALGSTGRSAVAQGNRPRSLDTRVVWLPTPVSTRAGNILVYELHITNVSSRNLTLIGIDVVRGEGSAQSAHLLRGDSLLQALDPVGARDTSVSAATLTTGRQIVVFMWESTGNGAGPTVTLAHRILVVPADSAAAVPDTVGPVRVTIPRLSAAAIAAPLEGGPWLASNGPSNTSDHRRTLIAIAGVERIAQRFATDWIMLGPDYRMWHGDSTVNRNWYGYGVVVHAAGSGVITAMHDGVAENTPLAAERAVPITFETVAGNYVIESMGSGRYALYAHLQPRSIRVRVGQRVAAGAALGLLGNSGNSGAPHLHFHLMDGGTTPLGGEGLPFVFRSYVEEGHLGGLDDLFQPAPWRPVAASARRNELPTENLVVRFPGSPATATATATAIEHVTVLDVERGRHRRNQTVVIVGNRIQAVGPAAGVRVPAGARVLDGRGGYLIPGLWDMHAHYWNDSLTALSATPLLLAHGVTGIRDMAGSLQHLIAWRDSVRSGRLVGPRAIVAGPVIDGPPPATEGDILASTPLEGRRAVDSLADAGVDFIKAYEMLRRDVFLAIVDEAHRRHLPVAGHVPLAVDAAEASDVGLASFEHLRNLEFACSAKADSLREARVAMLDAGLSQPGRPLRGRILSSQRGAALDTEDPERCASLLARLARNHTWQVPTLFLDEVPLTLDDTARMRRIRASEGLVPKEVATWWNDQAAGFAGATGQARDGASRYARWQRDFVRRLRGAGVGLLAGTDFPNLLTAPGVSLHEELRALRDAGLSNLEALQAATINPARFLHATDSLGTVAVGKIADLVLLDADPLCDIGNTTRIRAVVVNGLLLRRGDLDSLLVEARRVVAAP